MAEWQTRWSVDLRDFHCHSVGMKYTKELLAPLVRESQTVMEVIRKLGLKPAGGTHAYLSKKIREFGLDTSHFTGSGMKRGGGPKKKTWRLRRALIESGRAYRCAVCGNPGEWCGQPLHLQVDHRNRNWRDDRPTNLEFVCPNCHSQQRGWCGSTGGTEITSTARYYRERRKRR
jgi:hypothetical protein